MLDQWTEFLEKGGQVDAIYTDFEKAFDKVPHRRLISKLKSYGISTTLLYWIEDYLQNRKHRVKVNGSWMLLPVGKSYKWNTTRKCVGSSALPHLHK